MPRFRVHITVDDYWEYIVECADLTQAREQATTNFEAQRCRPIISVEQVEDDTPLGDA